jgi:hypothetical protein
MPFIKLQFRPGLNRDQTNYSGEGGWYDCDKIRFRSGYPEKVGGWKKATPTTILGVCRQLWNWVTSYSDNLLAIGTNKKVYIEAGGNFYDITPLRTTFDTPDTDNSVNVTNGSPVVVFEVTGHGANSGEYVTVIGVVGTGAPEEIGGIPVSEINGNHELTTINSNAFSIQVDTAATSTVSNAGGTTIELEFEISPGNAIRTEGYGWGTGTWSREAWGLGSTQPVFLPQRDWWFDNFDNDLVMNIRNGTIYYWERGGNADPSVALNTRASLLSGFADDAGYDPDAVPAAAMQILVSQQDKHLLAFGCVPFGSTSTADFDPLLIRWADQDNPFQWEPLPTNSAGFLRVSRGSRIIRALPTRQETLIWTDTHLYTLQFLGTIDVFSLQEYADNISIASSRACASAANITYWMGQDKFYAYTGRVETLPCTIRNYVFQNINFNQADQIICGTNEEWNEVWWFYPSKNSNWNDSYVVYNHLEKLWYYGTLERTAWLDTPLRENPQAIGSNPATENGFLYNHEDGVDDDDSPMMSYIQSNDFDLENGDKFLLTRRMIPDVNFDGSEASTPEVELVIRPRNFPGSSYQNDVADTQRVIRTSVDVYTDQVFMRARARQMALKIQSDALGVQWQLGSPRLDARADGQR